MGTCSKQNWRVSYAVRCGDRFKRLNKPKQPKQKATAKGNSKAVVMKSGGPSKAVMAPMAIGEMMQSRFQVMKGSKEDSIRVRGQDLLASASFSSSAVVGETIFNAPVSPQAIAGSRLEKFASIFEKYLFHGLRFHVTPSSASSNPGAYALAYDADPADPTPPKSVNGLQQLMSWYGSKIASVWQPCTISVPLISKQDALFCDNNQGDERLAHQGQVYLMCAGPVTTTNTLNLWVEYDCEFFHPQMQAPVSEGAASGPTATVPSDAWALFTDFANAIYKLRALPTGRSGYLLPRGIYELIQAAGSTTGGTAGVGWLAPTITAVSGYGNNAATNLWNVPTGAAGVGGAVRRDRVVIEDLDGAYVSGNYSTTAGSLAAPYISLIRMADTFV